MNKQQKRELIIKRRQDQKLRAMSNKIFYAYKKYSCYYESGDEAALEVCRGLSTKILHIILNDSFNPYLPNFSIKSLRDAALSELVEREVLNAKP